MSSAVRLAPWMPATRAVPRTSPFGASPATTAAAVSALMRTIACATARRAVAGLSPTSTMRAEPSSSRCVRSDIDRLGAREEVPHRLHVAGAQQLDRIGLAVDDPLEERLAILVGGQRAFRPA